MVVGYDEVVTSAEGVSELVCLRVRHRDAEAKATLSAFCVGGVGPNNVGDGGGETDGAEIGLTPEAHGVALA